MRRITNEILGVKGLNFCILFSTQTFDYNYHDSFTRGVEAYVTAEANVAASSNQSVDVVREAKFTVEAAKDKQFFFDDNSGALALPFTFAFLPFNDDEVGLCS